VIGVLLLVVGVIWLLSLVVSIDLGYYAWPLFVIVPGVLILVLAKSGRSAINEGLAITGSIVTVTGLILLYQNATGRYESWAYAWPLVVPGAVGAGMILFGRQTGKRGNIRAGRRLAIVAVVLFLIGVVFFELVLGIGGLALGRWPGLILSVLFIVAGVGLLLRDLRPGLRGNSR